MMPHLAIVAEGPGPRRPADPALIREIVADLRRRHSYATAMITALRERLEQDSEALASAAALIICVLTTDTGRLARQRATPEQRTTRREETRQKAKQLAVRARELILLDMLMPNKKRMRNCTGAEMKEFGVAYFEIAKRVGDENTVGTVLSEPEVKALLLAP
jgi:hypothetical protein